MIVNKMTENNQEIITRSEVLQYMVRKNTIESEIEVLNSILGQNNVGMHDPLVDGEGFPRNDIDVYAVRMARHQIIRLQNDHKELMKKIEEGLHRVHAQDRELAAELNQDVETVACNLEPFARIDLVSAGSPSYLSGLQASDLLLEFGSVTSRNFKNMTDVAIVVRHSSGRSINVLVQREGRKAPIPLMLTPQPWSGEGLIGCRITPLEIVER